MTLFSIVVDDIMTHYKKNHEATALADPNPESDRGPDPDPEKMEKEMEKIIHLVVDLEDMKSRIGELPIARKKRFFKVKELKEMVREKACELQYDVEWQACLIHYQVLRGSDSTEIPAYDFFLEKKDEKKDEKGHDKLTNRCQQYYRGKGEAFAPFIAMRAYCVLLHRYLNTSSCAGKVVCRTSYRIVSNHIASIHVVVVYPIFIIYLLTNFNSCSSYYLFIHSFIFLLQKSIAIITGFNKPKIDSKRKGYKTNCDLYNTLLGDGLIGRWGRLYLPDLQVRDVHR